MTNNLKAILLAIFSFALLHNCKFRDSRGDSKIVSQELIYDSISRHSKDFDVTLETTLSFTNTGENDAQLDNLFLIIDKSKFPLRPIEESKKFRKEDETLTVKFSTDTKFVSTVFKNDTLTKKIKDSKIIASDGKTVKKADVYKFKSLILGYPVNENGLKFE